MDYAMDHYNESKYKEAFDTVQEEVIYLINILIVVSACIKIVEGCWWIIYNAPRCLWKQVPNIQFDQGQIQPKIWQVLSIWVA